jgi:flagellar protein FliO/FliZ
VEFATLTTAIAALAGVLALVLLAGRAARQFGLAGVSRPGAPGRRLALVETLALDPRRRISLIRCDGRELLVLTGGPQDVLLPLGGAENPAP